MKSHSDSKNSHNVSSFQEMLQESFKQNAYNATLKKREKN